jgi:hypothetical protein
VGKNASYQTQTLRQQHSRMCLITLITWKKKMEIFNTLIMSELQGREKYLITSSYQLIKLIKGKNAGNPTGLRSLELSANLLTWASLLSPIEACIYKGIFRTFYSNCIFQVSKLSNLVEIRTTVGFDVDNLVANLGVSHLINLSNFRGEKY